MAGTVFAIIIMLKKQIHALFGQRKSSMLFHYLIREDEAQDPSSQLEQEDHCQTDTELGGRRKETGMFTAM